MSKRKPKFRDELIHLKKQKKEESLLHKLMFHPDINCFALEALETKDNFTIMQTDRQLFTHLPCVITHLQISLKAFLNNIKIFRSVKTLEIHEGKDFCYYGVPLVITQMQFPNLKSVFIHHFNVVEFVVEPSIKELIFKEKKNGSYLDHNSIIQIPPTLIKLEANVCQKDAQKLLYKQSKLEIIKLFVFETITESCTKYEILPFSFEQSCLTRLHFSGDVRHQVSIESLENMEELDIDAYTSVVNHATSSSLRWLAIRSPRFIQPIVGETKFPHLNYFLSMKPSFNSENDEEEIGSSSQVQTDKEALRIYNECIQRDKDIPVYHSSASKRQETFKRTLFLYCNNITSITSLTLCRDCYYSYDAGEVFIEKLQNLEQLDAFVSKKTWYIQPCSEKLSRVQIQDFPMYFNLYKSLFTKRNDIKFLSFEAYISHWNALPKHLFKKVHELRIFLKSVGRDEIMLLSDLPSLKCLSLDGSKINQRYTIRFVKLPRLYSFCIYGHRMRGPDSWKTTDCVIENGCLLSL